MLTHLGVSFDEAKLVILRLRRPVNPLKGGGHSNLVLHFKLLKLNLMYTSYPRGFGIRNALVRFQIHHPDPDLWIITGLGDPGSDSERTNGLKAAVRVVTKSEFSKEIY